VSGAGANGSGRQRRGSSGAGVATPSTGRNGDRRGETTAVDDGYAEFFALDDTDSGDYVRIPRRAPEPPRFVGPSLLVKLGVVLLLVMSGRWVYHQINPAGVPGETVVVDIRSGATTGQVADVLAEAGVIANARLFQEYARLKGGTVINAGSYTLNKKMALWEALAVLEAGPAPVGYLNLTVPEGLRLGELAAVMADRIPRFTRERVAAAMASGQIATAYLPPSGSLEGLLFPDTYQIADDADEVAALNRMAAQFDAVAAELRLEERAKALGLTPYEVVVVASMIEEEARLAEERPKIARVIYNRLREEMPLGIDATTLYAVGKEGNTLTQADLDSDSPYNTRKVVGLPPGPISAPGRAALEAALDPAEGSWLYYVLADADGRHAFTDDADEFEELVAEADAKGLLG